MVNDPNGMFSDIELMYIELYKKFKEVESTRTLNNQEKGLMLMIGQLIRPTLLQIKRWKFDNECEYEEVFNLFGKNVSNSR